jgi:hypothetical protein
MARATLRIGAGRGTRRLRTGLRPLIRAVALGAGAFLLATPAARAHPASPAVTPPVTPPSPSAGAVAFAWVDGALLGGQPGIDPGTYRPLATLLDIALPGATAPPAVAAIDAGASAAVLAGGSAWLSIDEVLPDDKARAGLKAECASVLINAPQSVVPMVRDFIARAGATSVKERPTAQGPAGTEFFAVFGQSSNAPTSRPRIPAHRAALVADGSKGSVCVQVFVDLNRLRHAVPDALDNTVLARTLGAWGLANARDVMLTARVVDPADVSTRDPALALPPGATPPERYAGAPIVRVDVTWSARSEEPSQVRRGALAAGFWDLGKQAGVPEGARWVMAVRSDLALWTLLALRTHAAGLEPAARGAFSREVERWAGAHGLAMDRLAHAGAGWLVLWPGTRETGPLAFDWRLAPDGPASIDSMVKDAADALAPFPSVAGPDGAGVRVAQVPGFVIGFGPSRTGIVGRVEFDASPGTTERVRAGVARSMK